MFVTESLLQAPGPVLRAGDRRGPIPYGIIPTAVVTFGSHNGGEGRT